MAETADYQAVLADLKARRARLDQLIAALEVTIMGGPDARGFDIEPTPGGDSLPATIHPDTFFGLSILDATKKFLKMARRAQPSKAIADALDQGGMKRPTDNVLSGVLVRAAKGREIVKVGKGMWGLSEWYPRPPKEPTDERQKPSKRDAPKATARKASGKRLTPKPTAKPAPKPAAPKAATSATLPSALAIEILRDAGKPMRSKEVADAIMARGVTVARQSVVNSLNRSVKAGKVTKVAPNTFAIAS